MFKPFLLALGVLIGTTTPAAAQMYVKPCCVVKQTLKQNDSSNIVFGRTKIDSVRVRKNQPPLAWGRFVLDSVAGPILTRWHDTTVYTFKDSVVVRDSVVPIFDTTFVTITDTIYDTLPVFDTTVVTVTDTIYDTIPVFDTTLVTITDTVTVYDTVPPPGGGSALGVPFGLSRTPVAALGSRFTYSQLPENDGVLRDLPAIKVAGGRISLNLTNSTSCALDASGMFSYALWEACFDRIAVPNRARILAYADSGVINDIYIIDEPNHQTRWGGNGISHATVERMAAHSKAILPGVDVSVRAAPEWLGQASFPWVHVDGAWAQYKANQGSAAAYARKHKDGATSLGLWLALALNVIDGGTADQTSPLFSGWPDGTNANGVPQYSMSPVELVTYGKALLAVSPCLVSGFRYDLTYLTRPGVAKAMDDLAALAKAATRAC